MFAPLTPPCIHEVAPLTFYTIFLRLSFIIGQYQVKITYISAIHLFLLVLQNSKILLKLSWIHLKLVISPFFQ